MGYLLFKPQHLSSQNFVEFIKEDDNIFLNYSYLKKNLDVSDEITDKNKVKVSCYWNQYSLVICPNPNNKIQIDHARYSYGETEFNVFVNSEKFKNRQNWY